MLMAYWICRHFSYCMHMESSILITNAICRHFSYCMHMALVMRMEDSVSASDRVRRHTYRH